MTFSWTQHRFSGGILALDVANTVVLRFDMDRRIDRYDDPLAMTAFAEAAMRLCGERERFETLLPVPAKDQASFLQLRETIDRHFRAQAQGLPKPVLLADLLDAASTIIRRQDEKPALLCLDAATAHSALSLAAQTATKAWSERLKICPNCGWLLLDTSRNGSRIWCDMSVCGNRAKAGRHYRRKKGEVSP